MSVSDNTGCGVDLTGRSVLVVVCVPAMFHVQPTIQHCPKTRHLLTVQINSGHSLSAVCRSGTWRTTKLDVTSHCVTSVLPLATNAACSARCIHMLYVAYMTNDLLLIFHVFIRLPGLWNIRGPLVVWPTVVDDSEWPLDIHLFWLFAYHFIRTCV